MEPKDLYLVIVNKTAHYYVRCSWTTMKAWKDMLIAQRFRAEDVVFKVVHLSDLDEINHIHFC